MRIDTYIKLTICSFLILFVLFIVTLEMSEVNHLRWTELFFMVYALGMSDERTVSARSDELFEKGSVWKKSRLCRNTA